jgi:DNA polymerase III delta subunit
MPKCTPKEIQKELEAGILWPAYWIYGPERMKSRELIKRIRQTVLGELSSSSLNEEILEGAEVNGTMVLETAQSLTLGGGIRLIHIRDAERIKEPEKLEPLLTPKTSKEETHSVCIFLAKDLDARKKFSKKLVEKAAVIQCEAVPDQEREAWIGYLSKRRKLDLPTEVLHQLISLDPWSLEMIDEELSKYELAPEGDKRAVLMGQIGHAGGTEAFLQAFLSRDKKNALPFVSEISSRPESAIPLLGLLAWHVRQLALLKSEEKGGRAVLKLNRMLLQKFNSWKHHWSLDDILRLQTQLQALDFETKQTPKLALSSWSRLVLEFTRS